jgi:uncharacterized protein YciI
MDSMEKTPPMQSAEEEAGPEERSLFAVIREEGPRWDDTTPPHEQDAWDEHLAFMGGLVDEGFVVLGGWLGAPRTLLVVNAEDEADVRRRFEGDPYTAMGLLAVTSVEPWELLLGRDLLAAAV